MAEEKKKMQALIQVEKISGMLNSEKKQAKELVNTPEMLLGKVREAADKLKEIRSGPFVAVMNDFAILGEMVQAYARGEYTKIPVKSIVAIAAMILYFLNPFDIIPDAIPFVGYIDDAFIVSKAVKLANADVKAFRKWQMSRS